ncbi:MAG: hypothetical protein EOP04_22795 [Proteobacteria bacterium]|nr:MAG: hypothetical protein EOP04_22795 [Pseudomonadota bacterium]
MAKVISLFKTDPHQIVSTLINKLTGFIETELDKTFIDDAWSLFADENQAFPGEDDPILDHFVP